MTVPNGNILFNNATGSETAASGQGPATAVSGNGAATVAGNPTVTLSANTPNLSTVTVFDVIWVDSTSGRQWAVISAIDDTLDTVTCESNYANTEGSKNWGIGGKRKTIGNVDGVKIFNSSNARPGWTIQIEDAQSISAAIVTTATGDETTGAFRIIGASPTSRTIITQTANAAHFTMSTTTTSQTFENLEFHNTNGTKTAAAALLATASVRIVAINCIMGHATNQLGYGIRNTTSATNNIYCINSIIQNCTVDGIVCDQGGSLHVRNSVITACVNAINMGSANTITRVANSIIYGNSGDGILASGMTLIEINNCTIHANGGDGIDLATAGTGTSLIGPVINNNNITGNAGYGINGLAALDKYKILIDYNNYGTGATANTLGARLNLTAGTHDIAVDPGYVNAAGGDFYPTGQV